MQKQNTQIINEAVHTEAQGHAILDPYGAVLRVSSRTMATLRIAGFLKRANGSPLRQLHPSIIPFLDELGSILERARPARLHASRMYAGGARGSGMTGVYHELGRDLSGANVVTCRCDRCAEKLAGQAPALPRRMVSR